MIHRSAVMTPAEQIAAVRRAMLMLDRAADNAALMPLRQLYLQSRNELRSVAAAIRASMPASMPDDDELARMEAHHG